MMFQSKFVLAVKSNNKILRESSGSVALPFGSEYTILLKNLNSRRAMVKVSVDGTDATDGTRLIIEANASMTLERFIRHGNLNSGNRFKFIERTEAIEQHRGIKEDDGLIRAEFWAERELVEQPVFVPRYYDDWRPRPWNPRPWRRWDDYRLALTARSAMASRTPMRAIRASASGSSRNTPIMASNCAGITVPGSESYQQFRNVSGFELESNSTVLVLHLRGEVAGEALQAPVTVDYKPQCSTCGKSNSAASRFCAKCGTALTLI